MNRNIQYHFGEHVERDINYDYIISLPKQLCVMAVRSEL
jgi:hypothetical protein